MIHILLQSGAGLPPMATVAFTLIVVLIAFTFYMVPTIVAMLRDHPNMLAIFIVNLLLGWLFVGWIVAMVWSVTAIDKNKDYR